MTTEEKILMAAAHVTNETIRNHMKDYVHETGNNIPQEIWDYIYKLTNGK